MSKALLLGSGMVSRPLISYLLNHGVELTVTHLDRSEAERQIDGHPGGTAVQWAGGDTDSLKLLVADHELIISLLPATMHVMVARECIAHRRHMVTTSYVTPEMKALDGPARDAGVLLLNEMGVDPGIDHMSAMRIIHDAQSRGGTVVSFRSYCGGLPAPPDNNNPFGYKFSWSPLAVLHASANSARFLKNGAEVLRPQEYVFMDTHRLCLEGAGDMEAYPNRDALSYIELYGLEGIRTMYRGTLRYDGWCTTIRHLGELGLLDAAPRDDLAGKTWIELLATLVHARSAGVSIKEQVAAHLWLPQDSPTLEKMEWLGLFTDRPLDGDPPSIMEQLAEVMVERMGYADGERDMIAMHHDFIVDLGDRRERITSTMVTFGEVGGDSAMARTVGLPAAIGARFALEGAFTERGVHIPVKPSLYGPVLDELSAQGIRMTETTVPL